MKAGAMHGKIHVVPCVVVFDDSFRVLLLRRSKNKRFRDRWEIPGGSLRFGETPRRGAARELREETGFDVHPRELIPVDSFGFVYTGVEFVIPLYTVKRSGEPVLRPREHEDWGWFDLDSVVRMERAGETMMGVSLMVREAYKVWESIQGRVRGV